MSKGVENLLNNGGRTTVPSKRATGVQRGDARGGSFEHALNRAKPKDTGSPASERTKQPANRAAEPRGRRENKGAPTADAPAMDVNPSEVDAAENDPTEMPPAADAADPIEETETAEAPASEPKESDADDAAAALAGQAAVSPILVQISPTENAEPEPSGFGAPVAGSTPVTKVQSPEGPADDGAALPDAHPLAATHAATDPDGQADDSEQQENHNPTQTAVVEVAGEPLAEKSVAPAKVASLGTQPVESDDDGSATSAADAKQLPLDPASDSALAANTLDSQPDKSSIVQPHAGLGSSTEPNGITDTLQPAAPKSPSAAMDAPAPVAATVPAEVEFGETNHDKIVTSLRTQLLPNGGAMRIRLDPPELGVLQVSVKMVNGVMTASFETSNDQATKLLSHSLGQLKSALESQGVSVEKLHVQQSPRDQHADSNGDESRQQSQSDSHSARQEQQRRELLQRMWRRLGIGSDPLDMVA